MHELAVEAVFREPVSAIFPCSRENCREFIEIWPLPRRLPPNRRENSIGSGAIPYTWKQGIFLMEQGIILAEQGSRSAEG
jgi:hypothetical protein